MKHTPAPAKLRRLAASSGLRLRIEVTRVDGEAVTDMDVRKVRADVAMLDILDKRTAKALEAVARIMPASMTGGLPVAPAKKTSKKASKK